MMEKTYYIGDKIIEVRGKIVGSTVKNGDTILLLKDKIATTILNSTALNKAETLNRLERKILGTEKTQSVSYYTNNKLCLVKMFM